jgi:hypothetical protein
MVAEAGKDDSQHVDVKECQYLTLMGAADG